MEILAEPAIYLLSYDGADYPVSLSSTPGGLADGYGFQFTFLGVDPFAGGYDDSGFTIYETQNGSVTGSFMLFPDQPGAVDLVEPGTGQYDVEGRGLITAGFDGYVPCFAQGTEIATPAGPVAVENLAAGTEVTTTTGTSRVVWIGHRRACDVDVVRIRRGTIGAERDLIVSDDHALFLDGVLVPAGLLVDEVGIVRERVESVTLYHVELERHAIMLADGVEAESYIDTGNRRQFGNCPMSYDPVSAVQDHCAEMVVAGARLEKIRARLALVPA